MTQIASIRAQTANKKLSKSSPQNYPNSFSENAKASAPSSFIGSSTYWVQHRESLPEIRFWSVFPFCHASPWSERPLDPQRLIARTNLYPDIRREHHPPAPHACELPSQRGSRRLPRQPRLRPRTRFLPR